MKKIFRFLLIAVVSLIAIIAINTIRFNSRQIATREERKSFPLDSAAVKHLSQAIQIRTISYDDTSNTDYSTFDTLFVFLQKTYPLAFADLNVERINRYGILMHWKTGSQKKPVIFYAHMDVVPADSSTLSAWAYPPFAGMVDEQFVYGRGTIDDKGSVIALLEAIEKLLKNNFRPSRDIFLAFGFDEEATGLKGAKQIADELHRRGVKAEFLLDEGGLIAVDMVPFVKNPVALIATSEKGYMSLKLSVQGSGGHSSFPPKRPPVETLADAITRIHDNPFPRRMSQSLNDFMDYAGPEMNLPFKAIFANRWLFKSIVFNEYEKIPSANAMIRTTSVTTIIHSGMKDNVIPTSASAIVNLRLLPGDDSGDVLKMLREIIGDTNVSVQTYGPVTEASQVSSTEAEGFALLQTTINKVFPDVVVTPSLLIGQTDSRHFRNVTENIYRFLPVRMDDKILDSMHGMDEKIGVKEFMESIAFYEEMIQAL